MQKVFMGWFGWSVLWLLPLLWRLSQAFLLKKAQLHGQGSIRLWLGTFLVLCSSSALEAFIRTNGAAPNDSAIVGQLIVAFVSDTVGTALGVLLLLATVVITLPWLFGRGALNWVEWCYRACAGLAASPERGDGRGPARYLPEEISYSRPARASTRITRRTVDSGAPKKTESWKLPALFFGKESLRKAAEARQTGNEKASTARPSEEWAPFESIRPTSAMLARANATQAANARKLQKDAIGMIATPQKASAAEPHERKPDVKVTSTIHRVPAASPDADVQRNRSPLKNVERAVPTAPTASAVPNVSSTPNTSVTPVALAAPTASTASATVNEADSHPAATTVPAPAAIAVGAGGMRSESPVLNEIQAENRIRPWQSVDDTAPVVDESSAPGIMGQGLHGATMLPLESEAGRAASSSPLASPTQAEEPMSIVRPVTSVSAQRVPMGEPFAFQAPSEISVDLPGLDLLDMPSDIAIEVSDAMLAQTGQLIEQRLKEFKVPVTVLGAYAGPVITRFEIEPAVGVRGAQIVGLMKDLARALGLTSIRVVETIPGKTCMGLELPNAHRQVIRLSEMLRSDAYHASQSHLTLTMGKDITGVPVVTDLARAPHMLVAGTTGSGKSVAINAMILSLLYKSTPADVRMIMIDPKMLELSVYNGIPHLLAPVVTDMKLAANALTWCVAEMERRYRLMSALGVRNLAGFNQKIRDARAAEKHVTNPFSLTPDAPEPLSTLPLIVVVIDELADLMMVAGKKIEELIARLAQKARAAGIHLILATQRPSVDVITGLIKANIPTRVAFQVSSKIDSRTVLDQMGAEALLGHGDMLFLPPGSGYPQRVHGAFVSDEEVHRVVEYLKQFGEPEYEEAILAGASNDEASGDLLDESGDTESDPLYDEAVSFVIRTRRASISSVQRQLRIGYNRAARLVEQMETAGILSPMMSNGSREILVPPSSS